MNLLLKPIFWVLLVGSVVGGFLVFKIVQVQATIDCGAGKVLQGIFPTICVDLPKTSSQTITPPSPSGSGSYPPSMGGLGCTGNISATGPGLTTGTAICSVLCPANKTAKIIKYTGSGTPFVSYDSAQGKYICSGKPTNGASSIQCECQ